MAITTTERDLSKRYIDDYEAFAGNVRQGNYYAGLGLLKLYNAGVTNIEIPETGLPVLRDKEDLAAIGNYSANEQDSRIQGLLCEWKSRGYFFTGAADFPFDTLFIDTVNSIELKSKRPDYYIFISQLTLRLAAIDVEATREWWRVEWAKDKKRHIWDRFYTCPKSLLLSEEDLIRRLSAVSRQVG